MVSQSCVRQLSALALDHLGNVIEGQPKFTWSITSPENPNSIINAETGEFTAGSVDEICTVRATAGGVSGTASVRVVSQNVYKINDNEGIILNVNNNGHNTFITYVDVNNNLKITKKYFDDEDNVLATML